MLGRRVGPVERGELQGRAELVHDRFVVRNAEAVGRMDRVMLADVADVLDRLHDEDHGNQQREVLLCKPG